MPSRIKTHQPLAAKWKADARRELDQRRGSPAARGYGSRWQQIAAMHKRRHPYCVDPFGAHRARGEKARAEHVDHIVPRRRGGSDGADNLQSLCASCHSRKTALHDGGFGNQVVCQRDREGGLISRNYLTYHVPPAAHFSEGFAIGGQAITEDSNGSTRTATNAHTRS